MDFHAASQRFRKAGQEQFRFPPGYSWSKGQAFSLEDETGKNMMINTVLALALINFVMAALFESLLHPFVILFTITLAVIGAALALGLTGSTISVGVLSTVVTLLILPTIYIMLDDLCNWSRHVVRAARAK